MASMSATKSFISSRNPRQASVGLLLLLLMAPFLCLAQVVPVQANLDAQAQRRIQEQSERVRRQRQIDANLEKIATALGLDPSDIGIKATTNEAMGFIGRREGIAAMAVAMVGLPDRQ